MKKKTNHWAVDLVNAVQYDTYTKNEVISMLEALRQRCAEEATMVEDKSHHWMCPHYNIDREALRKIDVHQFIPPLTK